MSKELRLSQSSTEMIQDVLENMRNYNFDSVNFPLLLYGVVNAIEENGECSPLQNYFNTMEAYPLEIEDSLSMMLTDYIVKLENDYEENHSQEKTSDNKSSNKSDKKSNNNRKNKTGNKDSSNKSKKKKTSKNNVMQSDFSSNIIFTDYEGKEITIPANKDIIEVNSHLMDIVEGFPTNKIDPLHFTVAIFMTEHKSLKKFFTEINLNYLEAKKYFRAESILKLGCIPFTLAGFMNTLNDKIDTSKPCEILKRDNEVESLWNIMLKKNKRNAVLVGEAGVGKTALIEKITYDINNCTCPKDFQDFKVIVLDVNALIAGTSYRGDAEERIKDVIEFLETHNDVILFIDEVHTILGAGSCFEGEMDFANALKPILARGDTIVIGATTEDEYEKYFKKDAALSRRFEKVEVKEPQAKDVYPMIKNKLDVLSEFHGVKITRKMVQYAIMIANCFAFEKKNPDKTLDLIDRAMVTAKRANKKYVDKNSILKNFGIFFEMWNNMSEDSKKEIAYHEAGHYIVGKASGRLIDFNWLAVSIMPAEDYLGVTVFEKDDTKVPFADHNYYIDSIAFDLGGRVAENEFRYTYTSGARADLTQATKKAYHVISKLGFGYDVDVPKNHIYLNSESYPMLSDNSIDIINNAVHTLINRAYDRAEKIIDENKDILEAIVSALMEKHIMSESELDKIWQDVVKKRNN